MLQFNVTVQLNRRFSNQKPKPVLTLTVLIFMDLNWFNTLYNSFYENHHMLSYLRCIFQLVACKLTAVKSFTSFGPCRRLQRSVRNMRASAGALTPLVGLLLRIVHLDIIQIYGRPKVDGSQCVNWTSLAHPWGSRFRLPVTLLLAFTLILRLTLTREFFRVVLVP